jgi:mono/diheme cytochrome c family protein
VPWLANDVHAGLKSMSDAELAALGTSSPPGTFARVNGSPYFPTKVPDLAGIRDRKYIDHTATHLLRGPEDVARYAALVGCCDSLGFGSHQMLSPEQRRIVYRFNDETLFALSKYLFALEPARNPNVDAMRAEAGKAVFAREGCAGCHTPPLYTNNKLTLAAGYTPPAGHPLAADILPLSVNTDPNLALKTRKGTGLYKVPSLRGVWYRTLLSHDGSVNSLEDWFDPRRLRDDYVPSGFKGYEVEKRAVPGHPFGLSLSADDKASLLAFLRSL